MSEKKKGKRKLKVPKRSSYAKPWKVSDKDLRKLSKFYKTKAIYHGKPMVQRAWMEPDSGPAEDAGEVLINPTDTVVESYASAYGTTPFKRGVEGITRDEMISNSIIRTTKLAESGESTVLSADPFHPTYAEMQNKSASYGTDPLTHYRRDQKKSYRTTGQEIGMDVDQDSGFKYVMQSANLYDRSEIPWYTKFNRFGLLDPYNALHGSKEYLFFTKPDLHICEPGTNTLNPELSNQPFFVELAARYPQVVEQLQRSVKPFSGSPNPFICLLSNSVKNKLDMPEISANVIDTGATIFNTSIDYRGTAFNAGEKFDFSLEFEDTKYLEIYMFFKAYEEYEQLKKIGLVTPPNINNAPKDKYGYNYNTYLQNKVLHDQFAIYKVIVDEDYEDIIFYSLLQGVFPKTAPREAFSDIDASNGLRYNIQFEANFVDDSKPYILTEFNALIDEEMKLKTENIKDEDWLPIYNELIGSTDGRWAVAPYIVKQTRDKTKPKAWLAPNTMNYKYKLKWRLS